MHYFLSLAPLLRFGLSHFWDMGQDEQPHEQPGLLRRRHARTAFTATITTAALTITATITDSMMDHIVSSLLFGVLFLLAFYALYQLVQVLRRKVGSVTLKSHLQVATLAEA